MLSERPDPKAIWVTAMPHNMTPEQFVEWADPPNQPPVVLCKGLCWRSCATIPVTPGDQARIEQTSGSPLTVRPDGFCSALTDDHRCQVWSARPLTCRMYGAAEGMICPHGCHTANGKYLSQAESMAMLVRDGLENGEPFLTGPAD